MMIEDSETTAHHLISGELAVLHTCGALSSNASSNSKQLNRLPKCKLIKVSNNSVSPSKPDPSRSDTLKAKAAEIKSKYIKQSVKQLQSHQPPNTKDASRRNVEQGDPEETGDLGSFVNISNFYANIYPSNINLSVMDGFCEDRPPSASQCNEDLACPGWKSDSFVEEDHFSLRPLRSVDDTAEDTISDCTRPILNGSDAKSVQMQLCCERVIGEICEKVSLSCCMDGEPGLGRRESAPKTLGQNGDVQEQSNEQEEMGEERLDTSPTGTEQIENGASGSLTGANNAVVEMAYDVAGEEDEDNGYVTPDNELGCVECDNVSIEDISDEEVIASRRNEDLPAVVERALIPPAGRMRHVENVNFTDPLLKGFQMGLDVVCKQKGSKNDAVKEDHDDMEDPVLRRAVERLDQKMQAISNEQLNAHNASSRLRTLASEVPQLRRLSTPLAKRLSFNLATCGQVSDSPDNRTDECPSVEKNQVVLNLSNGQSSDGIVDCSDSGSGEKRSVYTATLIRPVPLACQQKPWNEDGPLDLSCDRKEDKKHTRERATSEWYPGRHAGTAAFSQVLPSSRPRSVNSASELPGDHTARHELADDLAVPGQYGACYLSRTGGNVESGPPSTGDAVWPQHRCVSNYEYHNGMGGYSQPTDRYNTRKSMMCSGRRPLRDSCASSTTAGGHSLTSPYSYNHYSKFDTPLYNQTLLAPEWPLFPPLSHRFAEAYENHNNGPPLIPCMDPIAQRALERFDSCTFTPSDYGSRRNIPVVCDNRNPFHTIPSIIEPRLVSSSFSGEPTGFSHFVRQDNPYVAPTSTGYTSPLDEQNEPHIRRPDLPRASPECIGGSYSPECTVLKSAMQGVGMLAPLSPLSSTRTTSFNMEREQNGCDGKPGACIVEPTATNTSPLPMRAAAVNSNNSAAAADFERRSEHNLRHIFDHIERQDFRVHSSQSTFRQTPTYQYKSYLKEYTKPTSHSRFGHPPRDSSNGIRRNSRDLTHHSTAHNRTSNATPITSPLHVCTNLTSLPSSSYSNLLSPKLLHKETHNIYERFADSGIAVANASDTTFDSQTITLSGRSTPSCSIDSSGNVNEACLGRHKDTISRAYVRSTSGTNLDRSRSFDRSRADSQPHRPTCNTPPNRVIGNSPAKLATTGHSGKFPPRIPHNASHRNNSKELPTISKLASQLVDKQPGSLLNRQRYASNTGDRRQSATSLSMQHRVPPQQQQSKTKGSTNSRTAQQGCYTTSPANAKPAQSVYDRLYSSIKRR